MAKCYMFTADSRHLRFHLSPPTRSESASLHMLLQLKVIRLSSHVLFVVIDFVRYNLLKPCCWIVCGTHANLLSTPVYVK